MTEAQARGALERVILRDEAPEIVHETHPAAAATPEPRVADVVRGIVLRDEA